MVYNPVYKIVSGGAGGFMCPPGHPHHTQHLEGYESPRHRTVMFSGSLDYALSEEFDGSDVVKDRVRKILDAAVLIESEMWIKQVYAYFRSMYAPEDGGRDASKAVSHSPSNIAAAVARKVLAEKFDHLRDMDLSAENKDAHNYRSGVTGWGKRRGYEITAKADGSRVYVYALADDGTRYSANHLSEYADALAGDLDNVEIKTHPTNSILDRVEADMPIVPEPLDPARHLAVLTVRDYFPAHEPRLDLIADPGRGYGTYACTKCGEKVQYEAKFDKLTKVTTRIDGRGMTHWTYGTECPEGGDHTTD